MKILKIFIVKLLSILGKFPLILRLLLQLYTKLYSVISILACARENGQHPKHRIINYKSFFVNNILSGETVLDVGSGPGFLLKEIAQKTTARCVGVEISPKNVKKAKKILAGVSNAQVIGSDIFAYQDDNSYDVIVLSNVLEHIEDRIGLLKFLVKSYQPKKFLIRVPYFQRDWLVPYKKELGVEWRLDTTHYVEYTIDEIKKELSQANLKSESLRLDWGEIYIQAACNNQNADDLVITASRNIDCS
jgi:SAM-dependent methyltransferase